MGAPNKNSVLFVCLGNTCRSPMAEAVFRTLVKEKGIEDQWIIDSAGIANWHAGKSPNNRCLRVLQSNGITTDHIARQIRNSDFETFHWILGMDDYNISDLEDIVPEGYTGKIALLGSFDPEGATIISDPYCDNHDRGFIKCYEQCIRDCNAFLNQVMQDQDCPNK